MIELLVANGHRESEVLKYTLKKVGAYVELINQRTSETLLGIAMSARAATFDKEGFTKYVEEMSHGR